MFDHARSQSTRIDSRFGPSYRHSDARPIMRFLLSLLLLSASLPSSGALSGYLDMESGTDRQPVTPTILNAATHASGGTWTVNTTLTHLLVSTSFEAPLLNPVTIGSTTFRDSGSARTFVFTNTANRQYAQFDFTQPTAKLSLGLYMRVSGFRGAFHSFDFVCVEAQGDFLVVNFQDRSTSDYAFRVHTLDEGGVGPDGPGLGVPVQVAQDKTYWVTCLWDKANLKATLKVYDPATWLLLGTSENVILSRDAENICIGRYDLHSASQNASCYFDDLVWDATGATYPLFPASRTIVATDATRAAFDTAYSAAVPGDAILIPAGSNVWSGTYNLSKPSLTVFGVGSNKCVIANEGGDPTFSVTQPFVTISNLQIRGTAGANSGRGVETLVNHVRISHVLFQELADGTFFNGYGLIDHCILVNCTHTGRHFGYIPGGAQVRAEQYPIPFTSTNYVVWEDCGVEITPDMTTAAGSSISLFSSQEAASYIVRHSNIKVSKLNIAPAFDYHGNDPGQPDLRGVCGGQIYKVRMTIVPPATFNGKFVDVRGGQLLVYSNTIAGFDVLDNVYLREEDTNSPPTDRVENTYVFENREGPTGTTLMPPIVDGAATSKIVLNTHYFTNPPSGAYSTWSLKYPHPWTGASAPVSPPDRPAPPSALRIVSP
jgi:hypothetical protein